MPKGSIEGLEENAGGATWQHWCPVAFTRQSEHKAHGPNSTVRQDKARFAHSYPTHTLKERIRQTGCEELWLSTHNSQGHRDMDKYTFSTLPNTPGTFPTLWAI